MGKTIKELRTINVDRDWRASGTQLGFHGPQLRPSLIDISQDLSICIGVAPSEQDCTIERVNTMMLMSYTDVNGNPCREDEIIWDQKDLELVLSEPTIDRDEVLKSIRQHPGQAGGIRRIVVGDIETLRRLNLTEWVERVVAMRALVSGMSEAELEKYECGPDGYLNQ